MEDAFNRARTNQGALVKFVEKPKQLALNRRYIYTDVYSLLALIFSAAGTDISLGSIKLNEIEDITVARPRTPVRIRNALTKNGRGYNSGISTVIHGKIGSCTWTNRSSPDSDGR